MIDDNEKEEAEGKRITASSNRGESFYSEGNTSFNLYKEYLYKDPKTAGYRIYYPHGVVIEQSMRRNYYRGENNIYQESIPSLLRRLKSFETCKEKELYRMVSDMRIAEFAALLNKFEHVQNWDYSDILYEPLAQHYGLETSWLDITNDFMVALFFATCYYKDNGWYPLTKDMIESNNQYGMIFHMPSDRLPIKWSVALEDFNVYSNDQAQLDEKRENVVKKKELPSVCRENGVIYPLGFQPFMRCHMQYGYGMYMREPYPLQQNIDFEKLKFKQSAVLSKKVFDMMEGGAKIYPHEGLTQAKYIIDEIKCLTCFSEAAFEYALYRNHYYGLSDREKCLKELQAFKVGGKNIEIVEEHPWRISPGRRKRIDAKYKNFSLEKDYGITIFERKMFPPPTPMFEPWMLRSIEDEPGTRDFKVREKVACGDSIVARSAISLLATLQEARLQDF